MKSTYLLFRDGEVVGVFEQLHFAFEARTDGYAWTKVEGRDEHVWAGPRALGRWRIERWDVQGGGHD